MRLDRIVTDIKRTVERILHALDNNITAQENLGPSGAPEGSVLTSVGPQRVPQWMPLAPAVNEGIDNGTIVIPPSTGGGSSGGSGGATGPQGPPGEDGEDGVTTGDWEQLVFVDDPDDPPEDTWAYKDDGNPDIVMGWRNY